MMNNLSMPEFSREEPKFIELLKTHTPFVPHWEQTCSAGAGELDARKKLFLRSTFPDPEKLLETLAFDFRRFLDETGVGGTSIPVECCFKEGLEREEYILTVAPDSITVEGSDTEAVRRGIYFLRDKLEGSPILALGETRRKPWLRNRISRCFFGPIKRPPFNIDELMNDVDYYPEEYLHRLAAEGINGLWLTIAFREMCDTAIRRAPADAARRIAKLCKTVERCRRFGIKIWVFAIEPIFWSQSNNNPLPPGCEELLGPGWSVEEAGVEMLSFCPNSKLAEQYLYECTHDLFSKVPHLGGLFMISHGERMTSCLSRIDAHGDGTIPCKRRCDLSISEILHKTLAPMVRGMKDANPEADLISWLYMPSVDQVGFWATQLPEKLDKNVTIAFNFESGVSKYQLGKVRNGGDYWLSEAGPSDRFVMMAKAVSGHCRLAAKIQVGCSHECATVPTIPVPGILYRKYRAMKQLGVSDVIQCWYFGNYPGIMNEAAGKLAYEDFTGTEEQFLTELARPEWGKDAAKIVKAWQLFAAGYSNYPLDIQFQYYGPMHDGAVWPLWLKQQMKPLTRSWKPDQFPAGDALGECMRHFDLNELALLTGELSRLWSEGFAVMQTADSSGRTLDFTLAEALKIMFRSGHNILKFYTLRNAAFDNPAPMLMEQLKMIVEEEIANSLRLAELCEIDPRLGYHSEAEVYKYFPAKLRWRADLLRQMLTGEFKAEPVAPEGVSGEWYGENGIRWRITPENGKLKIALKLQGESCIKERLFLFFMDDKGAKKPLEQLIVNRPDSIRSGEDWESSVELDWGTLSYAPKFFFGIERVMWDSCGKMCFANDKPGDFSHEGRLYLGYFSPDKCRLVCTFQQF